MAKKKIDPNAVDSEKLSDAPSGFKVIAREFKKDKAAMFSLALLVVIFIIVFGGSFFYDTAKVMEVDIFEKYTAPNAKYLLGADQGGRDVLGMLILGAKNSILIGFAITMITSFIGVSLGIIMGYYGGKIDNVLMRLIDFIQVLPQLMLIIVFVTIIPHYTIWSFIGIMSAFYWTFKARLIRSKSLSESKRDYVSASKTMGTSDFKIMFREILPNISSLIIVNLTLNFAGNIGIETSLSFLNFGLPTNVPSLGTLIAYAQSPEVLTGKAWVWLPASILILVMMLAINYVGQAFGRAADARQRIG